MLRHHEMPLRALLRNMRLLTGLRTNNRQSLLLAGADALPFAATLRKLEPALDVSVVEGSGKSMTGEYRSLTQEMANQILTVQKCRCFVGSPRQGLRWLSLPAAVSLAEGASWTDHVRMGRGSSVLA